MQTTEIQDAHHTLITLGQEGIVTFTLDNAAVKRTVTDLGITVPREEKDFFFFVPRLDYADIIITAREACQQDEEVHWINIRFDCKQYLASTLARTQSLGMALQKFASAIERLSGFAGGQSTPLPAALENAQN